MNTKKLEWNDKYSVGVLELDNQHKRMFFIINELLEAIHENKSEEILGNIIDSLLQYKKFHFETEEKYFNDFNYEGKEEHIERHKQFAEKLNFLKEKYPEFNIEYAFELVDFLEDWLINHLMVMDQKYVKCFHDHGLK